MPRKSLKVLSRHCACLSTSQLAQKYLQKAEKLMATQKKDDVEGALIPLDATLELYPEWERALEMKARALLYLKRFREVVAMLQDHVPNGTVAAMPNSGFVSSFSFSPLKDSLSSPVPVFPSLKQWSSSAGILKHKLACRRKRKRMSPERHQWRFLVLGQACFYLGRMEDAMVLLQFGKRSTSLCLRPTNSVREDKFCADEIRSISSVETDFVSKMLINIKFLLRRRAAALAALQAGLYAESLRHFSKVIKLNSGAPHGFIADCYLHRAAANHAMGKIIDAIADCNKCLSLSPRCIQALRLRASLYESLHCFSECLHDLQHLKIIYETTLHYHQSCPLTWQPDADVEVALRDLSDRITAMRQQLAGPCSFQPHAVLHLAHDCTIEDVEKAFLLLSLKHKPDDASAFLEHWDYLDGRDMGIVKEEAQASASRLARLILKAYNELLSSVPNAGPQRKRSPCKEWAVPAQRTGLENPLPTIAEDKEEDEDTLICGELLDKADMERPVGYQPAQEKAPAMPGSDELVAVENVLISGKDAASGDGVDIYGEQKIGEETMIGLEDKDDLCCFEVCFDIGLEDESEISCPKEMDPASPASLSAHEFNTEGETPSDCSSSLPMDAQCIDEIEVEVVNMMVRNNDSGYGDGNVCGGLSSTILANALSQALFHDNLRANKASSWIHGANWSPIPLRPLPVT